MVRSAMNDTPLQVTGQFQRLLMMKKPEERLRMACSMFDAAKIMAKNSILERFPGISEAELKKQIFLRFYKEEFSELQRKKILESLI